MALAIKTEDLTKSYKTRSGRVNVVDRLNLEVEEGEIFGFLGPNGAGKTTTIKMLLSIIYPSSGSATVLGKEVGDIDTHRQLSYLPEKPYYYEHMTGREILNFYARLFNLRGAEKDKKITDLLEYVNLARDAQKTINQYSKGMQQRIGLAQSLLNDPKLLFLDEPTAGLDPIAHVEIRDLILRMREQGKTVFISSHELSDVERICDRVAILKLGKVQVQGRLDDLLRGGRVEITADHVPAHIGDKIKSETVIASQHGDRLIIDAPDSSPTNEYVDAIRSSGGSIVSVIPRRKRLEDLFVETIKSEDNNNGEKS
ncbi:MAG: ABC transporter ATP-binding protein [Fimbriimonadales bacterium]